MTTSALTLIIPPALAMDSNYRLTVNPAAIAARKRLQAALDQLNPAGGILDTGDGTGRHANKVKKNTSASSAQGSKNTDTE